MAGFWTSKPPEISKERHRKWLCGTNDNDLKERAISFVGVLADKSVQGW
jgi:hypothetical protein